MVWNGCQHQLHAFPAQRPSKDKSAVPMRGIEFLLQGKCCPLCNAAADEVMSLFQGILQGGRSGLFLSGNIMAYLFSFRVLQTGEETYQSDMSVDGKRHLCCAGKFCYSVCCS